jgi:hypothetical protein
MDSFKIAPPENLQLQSPLVRLPTEIKHMIFGYCFIAKDPIVDPILGHGPSKKNVIPPLGVSVLQTCRRVYHETDRRPLFTQNMFRFTTENRMRGFLESVGEEHRACVQDIEMDAQRLNGDDLNITQGWLKYLAWSVETWGDGSWKPSGSLHMDAPGLKCLRLNFESWPTLPMFRTQLWDFLRGILLQFRGLERVIVVGASKGKGMARRDPWSPVHFVGGDDVGSDDLVDRMWKAVGKSEEAEKVVRWERRGGKLHLEVVTKRHLSRYVESHRAGPCAKKAFADAWPENGSCTWFAYQHRNSDVTEPTTKGFNPSAGE